MPLVKAKAECLQRPVKRVGLRDSRSRWGSCRPDGGLSFSWRLVFAPPEVLDYLVAHEVAHLVHKNHGPGLLGRDPRPVRRSDGGSGARG